MVLHRYRIANGNSLIHDRTGVRSDDVIPHPPQRTRPDKAGFAAFWPRRYAKGIPARAELLWEQEAGIPERIASARWPRDAGLVKWKTLLAQNEALGQALGSTRGRVPHPARRRSLHTVLSAQNILPERASTGKDRTCRTVPSLSRFGEARPDEGL